MSPKASSDDIAARMEQDLDFGALVAVVLRRRSVVLAALAIATAIGAAIVASSKPVYQSATLLLIEKERGSAMVSSNGAVVDASNEDYYQTQYKLLKSESLLREVYSQLNLAGRPEFSGPDGIEKLADAIAVSPVKRSRLVYVKAESLDPQLSADISNQLSKTFVSQNVSNQLFISKEVLQALQAKTTSTEGRKLQEGLPAVVNNPLIQQMKADFVKLQVQLAQESERYTPKHPKIVSLRSNIDALRIQIDSETDKIVQSLKTDLSGQLKGNNIRIVDKATTPRRPIKPRKARIMAGAIILGLFAGLVLAIALDALDQTLRNQDDVENHLGQAFLGMVPFNPIPAGKAAYCNLLYEEPSLSGESLRNIRAMIDFAHSVTRDKHFLVTSTVQEEGKSFVAINLAVAFAQLGERVLIIDGDLRRPQLHRNSRTANEHGLSNFLATGTAVEDLTGLIQPTEVPGLSSLVCGTRPPNPAELLNTPRLSAAVAWAKSKFDRVIVDCTPIFPIHDTLIWARHIPSCVYVVRYGRTRIPVIKDAIGALNSTGIQPAGIILNAVQPKSLTYSAYSEGYRYYYSYSESPKRSSKSLVGDS